MIVDFNIILASKASETLGLTYTYYESMYKADILGFKIMWYTLDLITVLFEATFHWLETGKAGNLR